jgi:ATP-dependent Lon protease
MNDNDQSTLSDSSLPPTAHGPLFTELDDLLNRNFPGKVVRKDLTKLVKEGANVPVYVLEYLLGSYCASNDEAVIEEGLSTVKKVLAENYVRPDEAEKVKSTIRERGSLKVIDKVTVTLNEKRDVYEALLGNLGVNRIEVPSSIVKKFEKLLVGGIWCIATLEYFFEEDQKGSPFLLRDLKPIQMPNMDLDELFQGRRAFTEQQWIDALLRSTGMEPTNFQERVKWHLLARMIPLVENNYNLAELGPRGTGKSHIYKEISPNWEHRSKGPQNRRFCCAQWSVYLYTSPGPCPSKNVTQLNFLRRLLPCVYFPASTSLGFLPVNRGRDRTRRLTPALLLRRLRRKLAAWPRL